MRQEGEVINVKAVGGIFETNNIAQEYTMTVIVQCHVSTLTLTRSATVQVLAITKVTSIPFPTYLQTPLCGFPLIYELLLNKKPFSADWLELNTSANPPFLNIVPTEAMQDDTEPEMYYTLTVRTH